MSSQLAMMLGGILALAAITTGVTSVTSAPSLGERIYREGIVGSGAPLKAEREAGPPIEGRTAACASCHRRSGLGMKEGRSSIPPVAGIYLFHPRSTEADDLDLPFVENMRGERDPYTEETLARAIRTGIDANGHQLSYLMPHFDLDDADMTALIAYLRGLSPGQVPGVSSSLLHFATVVTPDADPVMSAGVVEVLTKFFDDKDHFTRAQTPRLHSSRRMMFKVNRQWQLHVWRLAGPPDTWEQQLRSKLRVEPVFAIISGAGGRTWEPVQRFCEAQAVPCLFPNVDLPVDRETDFDTLYFSKGLLLEAQLIAHDLNARRFGAHGHRVVQIYRSGGDEGRVAAVALHSALGKDDVTVIDRSLTPAASHEDLAAALRAVEPGDAVVLWLRAEDVAKLPPVPPPAAIAYLSGRMGGLEHAPLAAGWRTVSHMAYPFDLPEHRRVQLDYTLGWFRMRQIPVVAEQAQSDTFLACTIVSEVVNHMVDTFVRDYLVERVEGALEHRALTGYYPRLALAPGQRFASKGGYLVHFAEGGGPRVVADGPWVVP